MDHPFSWQPGKLAAQPESRPQLSRRTLLLGSMAALPWPALHAQTAQSPAESYPNRPIRFVVPFTAGSIGDLFIRPIAQQLGDRLGQPIIIDNRPGASQAIGAEFVARAAPDGYTVVMGTQSGLVLNAIARKKLPFDPVADFAPVTMLFTVPMYLFVNPSIPAQSIQEFVALARSKPGKLTFASIGAGTSSHLAGELLKTVANVDMLHVPYKGGPEATNALVSGQVDIMFNGGNSFAQMRQGTIRALGSAGLNRTTAMPMLPTFNESGMPGFEVLPWFGMFTPAGVPRPIIERLNREITAIMRTSAMQQKFAPMGVEVAPSTPEELAAQLRADFPVLTKTMRKAGIEAE